MEYGRCLLSKICCIAFVFLAFCFVHYFSLDALNRMVGSLLPVLHVCTFAFERFFSSLPANVYTVSCFSIPIQIMYLAFLLVFCFSLRTFCRSILKSSLHPIPAHCFPLSTHFKSALYMTMILLNFQLMWHIAAMMGWDGMGWGNRCNTALIRHIYSHRLYLYGINAQAHTHTYSQVALQKWKVCTEKYHLFLLFLHFCCSIFG